MISKNEPSVFRKPFRLGVVEGFFGRQWSWQARHDYASFLTAQGFNSYIYAPKNDGYFRKQWQVPCPADHLQQLQQLSRYYQQQQLDFGIGLSPFELYRDFSASNRALLQLKLEQINTIAPQTLCILFDDMMGNLNDLAQVQLEIVDFVRSNSSAQSFVVCPTYYSDDPLLTRHFGAQPQHYLDDLGKGLAQDIDVFWTGPKVISEFYPREHLLAVAQRLGRKPLLWDNYPVNDAKRLTNFLHLKPFINRANYLQELTLGHLANPMNQAYLSQLPLVSLAALYTDKPSSASQAFTEAWQTLCSPELATALQEDVELFHTVGLAGISAQDHKLLVNKYVKFQPHVMAVEVLDWLQGNYSFDPACLT